MKKILMLIILFQIAPVMASDHVTCFDANGLFTGGAFNGSFDPPQYANRADCEFDAVIPTGSDTGHWKRQSPGLWVMMTAQEIAKIDALAVAQSTNSIEVQAVAEVDAFDAVGLANRGFALVSLDEINNLRQWIESFKAAVAASTSLANLQSRVAALPAMPDRTRAQIIPAVKTKIQGGGAD